MSGRKLIYRMGDAFAEGGMATLHTIFLENGKEALLRELKGNYAWRLSLRGRFIQGTKIRAALSPHPSIANSLETGRHFLKPYEIIEKVPGTNLNTLIVERNEFLRTHKEELLLGAAEGLAHVHQNRLMHLDVKPENFLVDLTDRTRPQIKLTDFDLACPASQITSAKRVGTPAYMAPEQFNENRSLPASDVFAFGVMAYYLFSGHFPFSGKTQKQTWRHQADENIKPRPLSDYTTDISPNFERVIMRSLAKRTRDRYPSMKTLLQELKG